MFDFALVPGLTLQYMIAELRRVAREIFTECKPMVAEVRYKGPYRKREATLNGHNFRFRFQMSEMQDLRRPATML